jgi:hypothetical protein
VLDRATTRQRERTLALTVRAVELDLDPLALDGMRIRLVTRVRLEQRERFVAPPECRTYVGEWILSETTGAPTPSRRWLDALASRRR